LLAVAQNRLFSMTGYSVLRIATACEQSVTRLLATRTWLPPPRRNPTLPTRIETNSALTL
jgi:hypothetical protein